MKKTVLLLFLVLFVSSCSSRRSQVYYKSNSGTKSMSENKAELAFYSFYHGENSQKTKTILSSAVRYLGVPYRYGGVSAIGGFDCSGFVSKVFLENKIELLRTTIDQSHQGSQVRPEQIKPGDLLFFNTLGRGEISHVGIAFEILPSGEIRFIHASTSKGVTISSLRGFFWNKAFVKASRVF